MQKRVMLLWTGWLIWVMPAMAIQDSFYCAITLIQDTSWSTEHSTADLRSLERQVITSLSAGDYLEIISAHPDQPKLRLAQTINIASQDEFKQIVPVLEQIDFGFLSDARIAPAVQMALSRMRQLDKQRFSTKVIMIFSDGKVTDTDAQTLESMYPELAKVGIHIYMTGKSQTHRKILIAGNNATIAFSLLDDANPAQWLRTLRNPLEKPFVQSFQVSPATVTAPAKSSSSSVPSKPITTDSEVEIKASSEVQVNLKKQIDSKLSPPANLTNDQTKKTNTIAITPAKPAANQTIAPKKQKQSLLDRSRAFLHSGWFWMRLGLFLLASTAGIFLLLNYKAAASWASKIQSRLKKNAPQIPDRLIVRIGDRTQHLGRLDQIHKLDIGSSLKNGIRVFDKTIPEQHLRLFRKGRDFYLRNISKKPAWINSIALDPGKTELLPLPSIVKLSDVTTIRFELQKIVTLNTPAKEVSDGQAQ